MASQLLFTLGLRVKDLASLKGCAHHLPLPSKTPEFLDLLKEMASLTGFERMLLP